MTTTFMILVLIFGIVTIYLEIKEREKGEKIFYTFYLVVVGVILVALLNIINLPIVYIIFLIFYLILLYGIYTDFQGFVYLLENITVKNKKIDKKSIVKLDYELLNMIKGYYKQIITNYKDTIPRTSILIDIILLALGVILGASIILQIYHIL